VNFHSLILEKTIDMTGLVLLGLGGLVIIFGIVTMAYKLYKGKPKAVISADLLRDNDSVYPLLLLPYSTCYA
jgi:hypothetical protein